MANLKNLTFKQLSNNWKKYNDEMDKYDNGIKIIEDKISKIFSNLVKLREHVFERCLNIIKKHPKMFAKNCEDKMKFSIIVWSDDFMEYVYNEKTQTDEKILKKFFIDEGEKYIEKVETFLYQEEPPIELIQEDKVEIKNIEKKPKNKSTYFDSWDKNIQKSNNRIENMKQERKLQEQANAQAATIRCAQCHLYRTCCSYKKNKDPNCTAFRYRENFK